MNNSIQQKIVSVLLIAVFLGAGMTCYIAEDADRNNRIDLRDAVLNVQKSQIKDHNQANQPASTEIKTCISTMEAVAGIKNLSAASGDTDDAGFSTFCFLISAPDQEQFFSRCENVPEALILFTSIISPPVLFPPVAA